MPHLREVSACLNSKHGRGPRQSTFNNRLNYPLSPQSSSRSRLDPRSSPSHSAARARSKGVGAGAGMGPGSPRGGVRDDGGGGEGSCPSPTPEGRPWVGPPSLAGPNVSAVASPGPAFSPARGREGRGGWRRACREDPGFLAPPTRRDWVARTSRAMTAERVGLDGRAPVLGAPPTPGLRRGRL